MNNNTPPSTNDDETKPPKHHHPTITTPLPPRWRFVNEARRTHGYSTADAGRRVDGLSSEELAAKYVAPSLNEGNVGSVDVEIGRLDIREVTRREEEVLEGSFGGFGLEEDDSESDNSSNEDHPRMIRVLSRGDDTFSSEEEKKESDESNDGELDTTEEISAEFIGDLTMLSDGSPRGERISSPRHQRKDCHANTLSTNDTPAYYDQADLVDEKSTSFHLDGSFAQAISPFDQSFESEKDQGNLQRKKYIFAPLIVILLCALSITLGLILYHNKHSEELSEKNENSLKNLMFLANTTSAPSNSPSVSVLPQPTSRTCSEDTKQFAVHAVHQNLTEWNETVSWIVREACSGNVVMECQPCNGNGTSSQGNLFERDLNSIQKHYCLSAQNEYIFEIKASGGNGSCCGLATASSYTVVYGGDVMMEGDTTEVTAAGFKARFGESDKPCSTESPSALPSMQPSMVHSSKPSEQFTHEPSEQPSALPSQGPTCNTNIDDFNLCFALDMSGSVCNQGTGFECNRCEPSLICNADDVPSSSCCDNFVNVIDFAKGMVLSLSELESNQTYSVVQFATNASLVSSLTLSNRTFDALDEIVYTGGLTNHAHAINKCQQTLEMSTNLNATNLIMLITDGDPSEPKTSSPQAAAQRAARKAKAGGTFIIPIMISQSLELETMTYMENISSDGSVFNVLDFKSLEVLQESLMTQVSCQV